MTRPHPILKRDMSTFQTHNGALPFSACQNVVSPHVHFPPTPRICSMHPAYSPQTYDRAPIAVSPNACLLPKRGARKLMSPPANFEVERRGRSRSREGSNTSTEGEDVKGSYFHPRAYEACKPEPTHVPPTTFQVPSPPLLVADLSPSDESDDSIVTPPDHVGHPVAPPSPPHSPNSPHSHSHSSAQRHLNRTNVRFLVSSGEKRRCRPNLARTAGQKLDKPTMREWPAASDEGCLGGF